MTPPGFDEHLGLGEAVKDLPVEQFVAKRPIKPLVVAVFPRRTGRDVERLGSDLCEPLPDRRRDKFGAIV